ncbi:uncharacterized protein LOC142487982 [Ascaphus truei]|uniref:uncharacterized protein LOC142487982 n=1 Tax=Ascaphus truei TaxID=8439 RepID=UPI003F59C108
MAAGSPAQVSPTFDDVAVYFSQSEWKNLSVSQKELYKSVMKDNYECMVSLGYLTIKPEIVSRIESGEEPLSGNGCYPDEKENESFSNAGDNQNVVEVEDAVKDYKPDVTPLENEEGIDCKTNFVDRSSLINHKRTHTGERPHKCVDCLKSFNQKATLIKHRMTHTGERPFHCFLCVRAFIQNSDLVKHLRTHTGEKPYQCSLCERRFAQSSSLINHKRTHSTERPYRCSECSKSFSDKYTLIRHIRTYAKYRNYKSPAPEEAVGSSLDPPSSQMEMIRDEDTPYNSECGKSFNQIANLVKHSRSPTGERPYQCLSCGKNFIQKSDLVKHLRARKV